MKRIMVLLVVTLATITAITGQQQYWEPSKGPYGGSYSLVKIGNDTLYAFNIFDDWKKTYRSVDQGHTWQQLTFLQQFFPNATNKQVFVSEAGTVYMKIPSQQATYKTTDDGQTWSSTFPFELELKSGIMLKRVNNSVLRSTNSGQNWTTVLSLPSNSPSNNNYLSSTPFGGLLYNFIYATSADTTRTLYRSMDDGATWSAQVVSRDYAYFYIAPTGTILCTKGDTLLRSGDNGLTFQSTGVSKINSPSFSTLLSGRILLEQYKNLLYSDNEGITWDTLITWGAGGARAFHQFPPLADGTIFKNHLGFLIRSADDGLTWQFSGTNMQGGVTRKMVFVTDSLYYARNDAGLWKTNNAGETWDLLVQSILSDNTGGNFGITPSGGVAVLLNNKLSWAPDGISFTDVSPPNGLNIYDDGSNFFLSPHNSSFFINTVKGMERSTDFGQSWEMLLDSVFFARDLAFHPSGRMIFFSTLGQLMVSDNNGSTWLPKQVPENPFVGAIRVAPSGDVYLLGTGTDGRVFLWKSEDAGENWVKLPAELNLVLFWLPIFEVASNGHLFTGVYGNVVFSVNEGLTWQNQQTPVDSVHVAQGTGRIICLAVSPNQFLYAGTEHFDLYKSLQPVSQGSHIEGLVRADADADCSTPDDQTPLRNRSIKAEGDGFTYFTTTDPTGRYVFFVDTGTYNVAVNNLHNIWWAYCDSVQTINIPAYFTTDTANFSAIALAECPLMTVTVSAPFMRRCFDNQIYVQYCNQGSETADSAWVDVLLDPFLSFIGSTQTHNDLGNNTIRFFVGNIASGECGQFQLTVNVNCDSTVLGQTHCITAHGFPDTLCTTLPNWSGANIKASVSCQDSIVHFELQNTGPAGSQILNYIIIEDDVVMLLGNQQYSPGQSLTLPLPANGHTLRIESEQEPGHPFSTRAIAFEEGCGGFESLGFINQFSVNGITPSWHTMCRENTGAYDPNDKQGFPIGSGAEHRIRPGQPIEYMIRFQNTGTDTAFTVVVRDTLSAWLDPASLVPGAGSHPYTWKLEGQGVVTFTFPNILLPDSTTNLAGSQGFVTFNIAQQPNVPLGTQILNHAAIFFDFNEPVITNETLHTIGLDLVLGTAHWPKQKVRSAVQVSPNPAGAFAAFRLAKGQFKGHRLQLFSPLGKLVLEQEVNGSQWILPRNSLPAGAYAWQVLDGRGAFVGSGVVVFR